MDTTIEQYISTQPLDRQPVLKNIHQIIIEEDKSVVPVIEPMMGKEMIIYKDRSTMKYGLSSVKKYMSLHVLPIYGSEALHSKYKALLQEASFQKGCINFSSPQQMPLNIVKQLIVDCSTIDL
ncbi:MAG: hypothetical protein M3040_05145, partial [Bacteroidota bacterium]|nr:hypothetical protein [Bacteroidota bacterium]